MHLPEATLRELVIRYAKLQVAFGEVVDSPAAVEPTSEYFPDEYRNDPESVHTFLSRMISYTPVDEELEIGLAFVDGTEDGSEAKGSCSSGGCGGGGWKSDARTMVTPHGSGYVVTLNVADTGNPIVLATCLARSVGELLLHEGAEPEHIGDLAEAAAVFSGLGILLLEGSHVYGKSCGGAKVHRATIMEPEELATLTAIFARLHGSKVSAMKKQLATTQAEAFDESLAWIDSNPAIISGLRDNPEAIAKGFFELSETKGILGRLFSAKKDEPAFSVAPKTASKPRSSKLDEAKLLVAEEFAKG